MTEHPEPPPELELTSGDAICRRCGFSRQTLRRLVKAKLFPDPIYISPQRLAWRVRDIDRWIADGGLRSRRA